jgi:hypothetical protein
MRAGSPGCIRFVSKFTMVGLGRLELPTSPLSGVRSNHLSYRPKNSDQQAGGAGRDRTGDLLNANQALSQLSYSPFSPGERKILLEADWTRTGSDQQKSAQNKGSNSQIKSSGDPDTRADHGVASMIARSLEGNGCSLLGSPVQTVNSFQELPPRSLLERR